jgi:NTP pyrophosphatase (non-canonical NTP hydrolase)
MEFSDYQKQAQTTDQMPLQPEDIKALMLPLLGLAGETGSLLTHYKRFFRDGEGYGFFRDRISEELGDILWNVANIATKTNLSLEDVAGKNLEKVRDRWLDQPDGPGQKLFDEAFPENERFPRTFEIYVRTDVGRLGKQRAWLHYQGRPFGNELSDNSAQDDGYRLHDVFHLAFLAVLGWSPVMRAKPFFNCKRRSDPMVDEIQDGGRAAVIDEAIAALVFVEAKKNCFYQGVQTVEYSLLRTIKDLTGHLEVARCTGHQWELAILSGFKVWRALKDHKSGIISGDLNARTITFNPGVAQTSGVSDEFLDESATRDRASQASK